MAEEVLNIWGRPTWTGRCKEAPHRNVSELVLLDEWELTDIQKC